MVVNDGSTDATAKILAEFRNEIQVIAHEKNKGKGMALRNGFKAAFEKGFSSAITIDSDGQHFPEDIPVFIEAMKDNPGAVLMGSRNMQQESVPKKSSFGNRFSNFWFRLETGIDLPDTQTGFRLYPLQEVNQLRLFTRKFELEIEVLVKLAWRDVPIMPVPVRVKYDPTERVTHFRPFRDFTRISILNTWLVTLTLLYYLPRRIIRNFRRKGPIAVIKEQILKPEEPPMKKALSVGVGVFMGIFPIWGFQMAAALGLAVLFRLNKLLVIASSNISITPMIPPIIFASYLLGGIFVRDKVAFVSLSEVTLDSIHINLVQYIIGSILLAFIAGCIGFFVTLVLMKRRAA